MIAEVAFVSETKAVVLVNSAKVNASAGIVFS